MIEHSAKYADAIVSDSRKQTARAIFDLISPDAIVTSNFSNDESIYSNIEQMSTRDDNESNKKYATLEWNRWKLDGTWDIYPGDQGQVGWISESMSGEDGLFLTPYPYYEQGISGVSLLQVITLQFSNHEYNGYPVDFTIEIYGGGLLDSREITGNTSTKLILDGFNANYPTSIRLIIKKWSLPSRRVRIIRVLVGLYETWDSTIIRDVDIYTESTFSGLSLPYSTCSVTVTNKDHRFNPYAPNSIFKSIEERQKIPVELGIVMNEETEWIPGGTYYQQSGGWILNDPNITWKLVDIIGMLSNRRFVVPDTLPTNLSGWIAAIVSSLGVNFANLYIVDEDVAQTPLIAEQKNIEGRFCGEILRYACMATNTWPRQDMQTGKLRVGLLENIEGNEITLDNMPEYAIMESNDDIADITFQIDNDESITFPGTNTESDVSLSKTANIIIYCIQSILSPVSIIL